MFDVGEVVSVDQGFRSIGHRHGHVGDLVLAVVVPVSDKCCGKGRRIVEQGHQPADNASGETKAILIGRVA